MGLQQEIDALQRWVFQHAQLISMKLSSAPPTVARPVILWEHGQRSRTKNLTRYSYVVRCQQYGKLFVESFDQAATLQDLLLDSIEQRYGVLPVFEAVGSDVQIATLKNVTIDFRSSETMDIPIVVAYEATYGRTRPVLPPPATKVAHKITSPLGGE